MHIMFVIIIETNFRRQMRRAFSPLIRIMERVDYERLDRAGVSWKLSEHITQNIDTRQCAISRKSI